MAKKSLKGIPIGPLRTYTTRPMTPAEIAEFEAKVRRYEDGERARTTAEILDLAGQLSAQARLELITELAASLSADERGKLIKQLKARLPTDNRQRLRSRP